MATLNARLEKLESQTNVNAKPGTELMLNALRAGGFDEVCNLLAANDESHGREPTPFWMTMNIMGDNVFEFERYRGLVPDDMIRRAYNYQRNHAFGDEAIVTRVRQLAGVIDANGNVTPGYMLLDNGCIVDAPQPDVELILI